MGERDVGGRRAGLGGADAGSEGQALSVSAPALAGRLTDRPALADRLFDRLFDRPALAGRLGGRLEGPALAGRLFDRLFDRLRSR